MAKEIARIDFLKTFVESAEVMTKHLQMEEPGDMRYWKVSKKISELYPALRQAAAELNRDFGFKLNIPQDIPEDDFPRAEAFYLLHRDITANAEDSKAYQQAVFMMNPAKKSFAKNLELARQEVNVNGDEFDRYWMNKILTLDIGFCEEKTAEIFSGMRNEFLDVQLAEQMMSALVKRGAIIDAANVEGVRNVLADAADAFAKNLDYVSEADITADMIKRFQADCAWDSKNATVRETIADYMEPFTEIVAKNRPVLYKYDKNYDTALVALSEFDNCMSDQAYQQLDYHQQKNRELGIKSANFVIPEHYDLNKIFVDLELQENFDLQSEEPKPGSKDEFWQNYASEDNMDELLLQDTERMIGQMLMIADKDLGDISVILNDLEDKSIENRSNSENDEDEDEDNFLSGGNSFSEPESTDDIEKKEQILVFAAEILDLNDVVHRYYDIEMNETPIDRKIIKGFSVDEKWDDFTFSSLHMLFNEFDLNLEQNQGLVLLDENDSGIRSEAVEEIIALPSSLEKRNLLKLFKQGLFKLEYEMINRKLEVEADMVDDFTISHQSEYQALVSDLQMGQETFPEIDEECLACLAKDINTGAVVNYVVPLYDDRDPDENASFKMLEGIVDLEELSLEVRGFVKGVADRHVKRVVKAHNQLLDDGDFDRDLFDVVEEYNKLQENIDDICDNRVMISEELSKEEQIYGSYREFLKVQKPNPKAAVISALWANRVCNN